MLDKLWEKYSATLGKAIDEYYELALKSLIISKEFNKLW